MVLYFRFLAFARSNVVCKTAKLFYTLLQNCWFDILKSLKVSHFTLVYPSKIKEFMDQIIKKSKEFTTMINNLRE